MDSQHQQQHHHHHHHSQLGQVHTPPASAPSASMDPRPPRIPSRPVRKWVKQWVPQDTVLNNGKLFLPRWITDETWKLLKERVAEQEQEQEQEQPTEPESEVVFLCSAEGCGHTCAEATAMMKHLQSHTEKVCPYSWCGKRFSDLMKFKKHMALHQSESHLVCRIEGCGKAFPSETSYNQHAKLHSKDTYHYCPFKDCGKRYAHEAKLKTHMRNYHGKDFPFDVRSAATERDGSNTKNATPTTGVSTSDRPYSCPHPGCDKHYKHAYKLNLHLRNAHADNPCEENGKHIRINMAEHEVGGALDRDENMGKNIIKSSVGRGKLKFISNSPVIADVKRKHPDVTAPELNMRPSTKPSVGRTSFFAPEDSEDDSEKTEDDAEGEGWVKKINVETDDEETEDELS